MKVQLRDYQRQGILHLANRLHAGLFYDPGLGKTLTTLSAFELLRMKGKLTKGRMLIVAPLSVAQTVWQDEIAQWDHLQPLTCTLLHGPKKLDRLADAKWADVSIINYEGLKWLEENLTDWPWDILVFDELSKCKNVSTQRAKIIMRIRRRFDRVWGLTGTPVPNSMLEIFGQIRALDGGKALGPSIWKFREKHFYQKPFRQYDWYIKDGHEQMIVEDVEHLVHRLDCKKHLDMPELIDVWHPIRVKPATAKRYKQMEKDFYLSFGEDEIASAVSAGVQWGKLQQICQGFSYIDTDEDNPEWKRFDDAKLDALQDIIEEAQGQPVLVFYKFKADLYALKNRFNGKKAPRGVDLKECVMGDAVRRWNDKEIPLLFANPQSAGHGLNLQKGGHIIVWYCLDSSNERYIQAKGRLWRQGQTHDVINHHLMVPGTVDEDIREVLAGRATVQDRVQAKWEAYNDVRPTSLSSPDAA